MKTARIPKRNLFKTIKNYVYDLSCNLTNEGYGPWGVGHMDCFWEVVGEHTDSGLMKTKILNNSYPCQQ